MLKATTRLDLAAVKNIVCVQTPDDDNELLLWYG